MAVRHAITTLLRTPHHAHALGALVLDLPLLDDEALGVAVIVLLARADAPEGRDLLALLLRKLALLGGRLEDAPRDVIVDACQLIARFRRALAAAALGRAR